MFKKQAVWCQCASIISAVFAGACIVSIQETSYYQDIIWFLIFGINALIHFTAAEHATIGFIDVTMLITIEKWLDLINCTTIFIYNLPLPGSMIPIVYLILPYVLFKAGPKIEPIITALILCIQLNWFVTILACVYLLAKVLSKEWFTKTNRCSIAGTEIRRAYLWKTVWRVSLYIILWQIRCQNRFPSTLRWRPIILAFVWEMISMIYCHYNVLPTIVSNNAIIQYNELHPMAASLKAAHNCPICRRYLTALDMESSFGDGL